MLPVAGDNALSRMRNSMFWCLAFLGASCGVLAQSGHIRGAKHNSAPGAKHNSAPGAKHEAGWPEYGGDASGQRYSEAREITRENVAQLQVAWTFHTHALDQPSSWNAKAAFEATPVLWNGTLYFDPPFDQVFAIDAQTGKLKWSFDPKIERENLYIVTSRGVALWHAEHPGKGVCEHSAVLVATLDRRLIALDALRGKPCPRFGTSGTVDLAQGVEVRERTLYKFTSAPLVVRDKIIMGSFVGDNQQLFVASGATRGFDARSGKQVWSWEPVRWTGQQKTKLSGSGNAWAPLAADPEHDLVFRPTGSASVDYYGGMRAGDNRDANSLVALRASTGEKVWAFQLVHHDLWDYDTASQPLLFSFHGSVPAVAITNKTGMIYVFNRLTGEPLYPIEERPVAQSTLPGEVSFATQPFSSLPPLAPLQYSAEDLQIPDKDDRIFCENELKHLHYQGIFTPPSKEGSLEYPASLGGPNWGSSALDPATGVLFTRTTSMPFRVQMLPQEMRAPSVAERLESGWRKVAPVALGGESQAELSSRFEEASPQSAAYRPPDMGVGKLDVSPLRGAPYRLMLRALVGPHGTPCGPAPYGRIVATDLNTGKQLWSVAHGQMIAGLPGSIGVGGTIVTAGGLVFAGSTNDPYLRAYDKESGRELWKARLPASANATPMTYEANGRQYLVIAAGGHRTPQDESDAVVAFALPQRAR